MWAHLGADRFFVIDSPTFNVIIGLPTLELLQACIDLSTYAATMSYSRGEANLNLEYSIFRDLHAEVEMDREDFTSE